MTSTPTATLPLLPLLLLLLLTRVPPLVVNLNLIRVNINYSPRHLLSQSKTGVDFRDVDTHRDPAASTAPAASAASATHPSPPSCKMISIPARDLSTPD